MSNHTLVTIVDRGAQFQLLIEAGSVRLRDPFWPCTLACYYIALFQLNMFNFHQLSARYIGHVLPGQTR